MNLDKNPKIDELRDLLRAADDGADHHILWVSNAGDVRLDTLRDCSGAGFEEARRDDLAFRLETFARGGGHVGTDAARDDNWVSRLYRALVSNWKEGARGYIDVF